MHWKYNCLTIVFCDKQENEKAINDALMEFTERMTFLSEMFPVSVETFTEQAVDAQASAITTFLSAAVNIEKHNEFQTKLEGHFTETVIKFDNKNNQASELKCKQVKNNFVPFENYAKDFVIIFSSWLVELL